MKASISLLTAGWTALALSLGLLTGCSITDPTENFKVIIEGEIEKSVIESREYSAVPFDTLLLQDRFIGDSTSLVGGDKGGKSVAGADAPRTDVLELRMRTWPALVTALEAIPAGQARYSDLFGGTYSNISNNPVTITFYYDLDRNLNLGILDRLESRVADFTIPARGTKTIDSDDDFDDRYPTGELAQAIARGLIWNERFREWIGSFSLYIAATGDPVVAVTIDNMRLLLPSLVDFIEEISPSDLRDYTLEQINSIGLIGRAVNAGQSEVTSFFRFNATANFYGPEFSRFVTPAGDTTDFRTDQYLTQDGPAVMRTWFAKLFPPESATIYLIGRLSGGNDPLQVRLEDLGVVANARIEERQ